MKFPKKIDRIMPRVLKRLSIDRRMKNWQILEKWPTIVGNKISFHATAVGVDTDTLYVEVDSPLWQSQLFLMKESILKKCREFDVKIKDINFRIKNHKEQA